MGYGSFKESEFWQFRDFFSRWRRFIPAKVLNTKISTIKVTLTIDWKIPKIFPIGGFKNFIEILEIFTENESFMC